MKKTLIRHIIVFVITLFIGCDSSLLFAADAADPTNQSTELQLEQLRQVAADQNRRLQQANTNATGISPVDAPPPPIIQNPTPQPSISNGASPANAAPVQIDVPPQPMNALTNVNAASTPCPTTEPAGDVCEQAFNGVARTALPMSPEQIQRLRQLFTASQYAASIQVGVPPKPVIRSQMVNLSPGATPPPIRMKQGVVTTLAFIDATGQPWPIDAYDIGDPATFNVQWNKTDNVLFVQPSKQFFDDRNLVVRLRGLATPVTLTLLAPQLSNRNAVDYRVDLHIPEAGPNAVPIAGGDNLPNSADPVLLGVLSGVPPEGSKELSVSDNTSQAWMLNDKLFLRTRSTVLSPAWLATMSSADGMKAYLMPKTPMILVSQHGKAVQLRIEGL